jgi:hypothetical protein
MERKDTKDNVNTEIRKQKKEMDKNKIQRRKKRGRKKDNSMV